MIDIHLRMGLILLQTVMAPQTPPDLKHNGTAKILSRSFTLFPFDRKTCNETVDAKATLTGNTLHLMYSVPVSLTGTVSDCCLDTFQRKNELWKTNCLELFTGSTGEPGYLEYNFSFTGDWNCYRFDSYRKAMRKETAVELNAFSCTCCDDRAAFRICTTVPEYMSLPVVACPTAVIIDSTTAQPHYFAPAHPDDKADFHLATIRVPIG